ncbi:FAD dependent oxidoreductase-domain-containing protein [Coprinopsis sp. MPI-PUGE-AT-0042]|nr:FAD dependent oxidoreductase-domain-containing protein [Coprinopsis sp. MPI-PUGE-AT-0042]
MEQFLRILKHCFHLLFTKVLIPMARLYPPVNKVFERVHSSPGIPVSNPSPSYWMEPPSPISERNADPAIPLPEYADIVIVGAGITGASFARTVLEHNDGKDSLGNPLKVIIVEARGVCSGATGRNGGHLNPILYQEYLELKAQYGKPMAQKIICFRLAHVDELLEVSKEGGLDDDSQAREVEAFDVYSDHHLFETAKEMLAEYQEDFPDASASYRIYEDPKELRNLQLSSSVVGCFSTRAAALHPYRLVNGILALLLKSYPTQFDIFTHTPCTDIRGSELTNCYTVVTPRGSIGTRHVIHATNGWASHLLPGMRKSIVPARGVMTAQVPRQGLGNAKDGQSELKEPVPSSSWTGKRSFVFYPRSSLGVYDYLTQQLPSSGPSTSYPQPCAELMLGGGFAEAPMSEIGCADDSQYPAQTKEYLSTALSRAFSVRPDGGKDEGKEELKATWSGVLGLSSDELPWVGRIPVQVTGRSPSVSPIESVGGEEAAEPGLASPGEWIAAGYSGEGMVHAWLSGKALAHMVMGLDDKASEWFPEVFRMTEERLGQREFEDLMVSYILS